MFAAVYSWRAMGPAVLDPEVGIDFSRLVHGGQDFTWHAPVVAGDEITTEATFVEKIKRGEIEVFTFSSRSINQRGELVCEGTMDELREMTVTPDRYVDVPLRGRLRRLQPDPPRRRVRSLGRVAEPDPARPVDDGAGRARPGRGRRRPAGAEVAVRPVPRDGRAGAGDHGHLEAEVLADGEAVFDCEAVQDGNKLVRRGAPCCASAGFLESKGADSPPGPAARQGGGRLRAHRATGWLQDARLRPRRAPPGRRRSATSSRCSRRTGCSRIRTRPPGGFRPTRATATTSIACCPTRPRRICGSSLVRREVDEAMRMTTETLSQVDEPAGDRQRAADRDDDDPPHRGPAAAAAGR